MYSQSRIMIWCLIFISTVSIAQDQQPPNRTGRTITNRDSYTNRNPTIQPRPGEVIPMSPALTPVVSEDPFTGERTTHVVVEEDYPSEYRTIMIRDPRTGRTIAQRVPGQSFGDMETIIKRRIEQYRQKLQIADDQWQTVQPLLERIFDLQFALNPAAQMRLKDVQTGIPQISPEPNELAALNAAPNPKKEVTDAYDDLRLAADDPQSPDELIVQKMTAYMQVRQKYRDELKSAQDQLRQALTIRQQAILTIEGVL